MSNPVVVIHGGAGSRPTGARSTQLRKSLRAILAASSAYLKTHSALETVAFAVQQLENDPFYNAGTGSMLQSDGVARMSASIMDGAALRFAAVLNIEQTRNPVLVAQTLLAHEDRVLAAEGATRFARANGFARWNPVTPARLRQWQRRLRDTTEQGTVGAVALDRDGRLAAATSTGGKGCERVGRVSDSGLPVGNYADDAVAISCTGIGEHIIEEGLAVRLAQRVADGRSLARAFTSAFRLLKARQRWIGAIGVDRRGRVTWGTTVPAVLAMAQTRAGRAEAF